MNSICFVCAEPIKSRDSSDDECQKCPQKNRQHKICITETRDGTYCNTHIPQKFKCTVCNKPVSEDDEGECENCPNTTAQHTDCVIEMYDDQGWYNSYCPNHAPDCGACGQKLSNPVASCDYDECIVSTHKLCLEKIGRRHFCPTHAARKKNEGSTVKILAEYSKKFWEDVNLTIVRNKSEERGVSETDKIKLCFTIKGPVIDDETEQYSSNKMRVHVTPVFQPNSDEIRALTHKVMGTTRNSREYEVPIVNHDEMVKRVKKQLIASLRSKKSSYTIDRNYRLENHEETDKPIRLPGKKYKSYYWRKKAKEANEEYDAKHAQIFKKNDLYVKRIDEVIALLQQPFVETVIEIPKETPKETTNVQE